MNQGRHNSKICDVCNKNKKRCVCHENLSRNYVRETSVVADVLSEHGIDIVLPPEDLYILKNPVFNYRVFLTFLFLFYQG